MTEITRALAYRLAPSLPNSCTREDARDLLDEMTAGDLDCLQMDKLITWTFQARGWFTR